MKYIVSENKVSDKLQKISVQQSKQLLINQKSLGIDTETLGLDCHSYPITLLQFGTKTDQVVIDCSTTDIHHYKDILESNTITKIGANLKFDLQFLYKQNIWCQNVWDILLAEYVMYNGLNEELLKNIYNNYCNAINASQEYRKKMLRKAERGYYSLLSLVFKYTGKILNKSTRESFNDFLSESFLLYACQDVEDLIYIANQQYLYAVKDDCLKAIQLENKFVEALSYIEFCGLGINQEKWMALYNENSKKCKQSLKELDEYVYSHNLIKYKDQQLDLFTEDAEHKTTINWNSQPQLIELFQSLGVDTVNKDGEISVDASVLEEQKDKCDLIPIFLQYNDYKKLSTTYGKDFLQYVNPTTGRIHCDYTQLVSTSRLSSSKPNLQNIPATEEFRAAFECKEGNLFCSADYGG